jgi:hypothetical protein
MANFGCFFKKKGLNPLVVKYKNSSSYALSKTINNQNLGSKEFQKVMIKINTIWNVR